jgi:hypothetical protein
MRQPTPPVFTERDAFLDQVLRDGRYIDRVWHDPRGVARALQLDLSPQTLDCVASTDRDELLNDLYCARFNPDTTATHPYIVYESATAGVLFIIGGVVVGIAIVAIVVVKATRLNVTDLSPYAESKL